MGFTVSTEGKVENANVIDSDPPRVFDEAALAAVRQWTCDPKLVQGKQAYWRFVEVLLRFTLPR